MDIMVNGIGLIVFVISQHKPILANIMNIIFISQATMMSTPGCNGGSGSATLHWVLSSKMVN